MAGWAFLAAAIPVSPTAIACPDKAPIVLVTLADPKSDLAATIAPARGGQLVGLALRDEPQSRELLWRGMNFCQEPGWDGKAPLLFPAVGPNFAQDDAGQTRQGWRWQGRFLPMPNHGFARDLPWQLLSSGPNRAVVRLVDSESTRIAYPFGFTLDADYRLHSNRLTITYRLVASPRNSAPMPFAIGNHITFAAGRNATLTSTATRDILLDAQRRPTGEIAPLAPLDAAPLEGWLPAKSRAVGGDPARWPQATVNLGNNVLVSIRHRPTQWPQGTPVQFNHWGDLAQGYYAPEPWVGKQNALASGDGAVVLAPGGRFEWIVEVRVARSD